MAPNRKKGIELDKYLKAHYSVIPINTKEANKVFIGIDLVTGYFCVEGSEKIYDELFAYRGLDERDLENFYLVAEYIKCTNQ